MNWVLYYKKNTYVFWKSHDRIFFRRINDTFCPVGDIEEGAVMRKFERAKPYTNFLAIWEKEKI
jgi:hypothetical protein